MGKSFRACTFSAFLYIYKKHIMHKLQKPETQRFIEALKPKKYWHFIKFFVFLGLMHFLLSFYIKAYYASTAEKLKRNDSSKLWKQQNIDILSNSLRFMLMHFLLFSIYIKSILCINYKNLKRNDSLKLWNQQNIDIFIKFFAFRAYAFSA